MAYYHVAGLSRGNSEWWNGSAATCVAEGLEQRSDRRELPPGDHAEQFDLVAILDFVGNPFTLEEGGAIEFHQDWVINSETFQELGKGQGRSGEFVVLSVDTDGHAVEGRKRAKPPGAKGVSEASEATHSLEASIFQEKENSVCQRIGGLVWLPEIYPTSFMADNIQEKVKDIIVEQLGVDAGQVTPEAKFVEDLGADSLDTVELVMAFEEEFGIEVPDEDAEKLQTVGDVLRYVEERQKAK